jgi:heme-degrading monooxygenase HmoA
MYARASSYTGDIDRLIDHFASVVVALEQWNGLDHVHLLVDREAGRAIALSVWVDREALERSEAGADEMRNRVAGVAGVTVDSVERFEVVRTVRGPAGKGFLPFPVTEP